MVLRLAVTLLFLLCAGAPAPAQTCAPGMPCWTTGSRPPDAGPPLLGQWGFNRTTEQIEFWNGYQWVSTTDGMTNVRAFGALGNTVRLGDGVITAGTNVLTSAMAFFDAAYDIGKTVAIEQAGEFSGPAGSEVERPLVSTIVEVLSPNSVRLAHNAVATTGSFFPIWLVRLRDSVTTSSYAAGDRFSGSGPTGSPHFTAQVEATEIAWNTVDVGGVDTVTGITIVNPGSGGIGPGGNGGNCFVQGTTGDGQSGKYPVGDPNAPYRGAFQLVVNLVNGQVDSVVRVSSSGIYTTNPDDDANEPIIPINGCYGLTGAVLSFKMRPLIARVLSAGRGVYPTIPLEPDGDPRTVCKTAPAAEAFPCVNVIGTGAGATFAAAWIKRGAFSYGTDDTRAISAAFDMARSYNYGGYAACVYFPPGKYWISSPMPRFNNAAGCIHGADQAQSQIIVSPSLIGDVFSWSNSSAILEPVQGGVGNGLNFDGGFAADVNWAGAKISNLRMSASHNSPNTQNAIVFYDRNSNLRLSELFIRGFNGYGIATGVSSGGHFPNIRTKTTESDFSTIKVYHSGNTAFTDSGSLVTLANGTGGSGLVNGNYPSTDPVGTAIAVTTVSGSGSGAKIGAVVSGCPGACLIRPTVIDRGQRYAAGDSVTVPGSALGGSGTVTFNVTVAGLEHPAVLFDTQNAPGNPEGTNSIRMYDIQIFANHGHGLALRNSVGASGTSGFHMVNLRIEGLQFGQKHFGAGVADLISVGSPTDPGRVGNIFCVECTLTSPYMNNYAIRLDAIDAEPEHVPYLIDWAGQMNGNAGWGLPLRVNKGRFSSFKFRTILARGCTVTLSPDTEGGIEFEGLAAVEDDFNFDYCFDGAPTYALARSVQVNSASVGSIGSQTSYARTRPGALVRPGKNLVGATSQETNQVLQCATVGPNHTDPCQLTIDGLAPNIENCVNLGNGSNFRIAVELQAKDIAQFTNHYTATWNAAHWIERTAGPTSTLVDGVTSNIHPDSAKVSGTTIGSAVMSADLVNGCLKLVHTPDPTNGVLKHQLVITAKVTTVE